MEKPRGGFVQQPQTQGLSVRRVPNPNTSTPRPL
jgi:hypothetical protein